MGKITSHNNIKILVSTRFSRDHNAMNLRSYEVSVEQGNSLSYFEHSIESCSYCWWLSLIRLELINASVSFEESNFLFAEK